MSTRTALLQVELDDLTQRIKVAVNAHEAAKSTFGRLEAPPSHPMWDTLREDIDRTHTHLLVLQAHWHRVKAQLLEQQAKELK